MSKMRISKRLFRHKVRYGFHPYFDKRGNWIPDPYTVVSSIADDLLPTSVLSSRKLAMVSKKFRVEYMRRFSRMDYRSVARTLLPGGTLVSTVCLMLNHQHDDPGIPVLFETMVFSPFSECELYCERYYSLSEARKGHRKTVLMVRNSNKTKKN